MGAKLDGYFHIDCLPNQIACSPDFATQARWGEGTYCRSEYAIRDVTAARALHDSANGNIDIRYQVTRATKTSITFPQTMRGYP